MTTNKDIIQPINDEFWCSDLDTIEKSFLRKGDCITDLPTYLSLKVPPQGSVLLHKSVKIDIPHPTIIQRTILQIKKFFEKNDI